MSKIIEVNGKGLILEGGDMDTDRIIPSRFLKTITFIGLGQHVFEDDRKKLEGKHPFDFLENQSASILIAGENFGCGSSREHAPQALMDWGIKAIIAPSFAAIFRGNCTANGIPCVSISEAGYALLVQPGKKVSMITIDLEKMEAKADLEDGSGKILKVTVILTMPPNDRQMLIEGVWDTTGTLLEAGDQIEATLARLPYGTQTVA